MWCIHALFPVRPYYKLMNASLIRETLGVAEKTPDVDCGKEDCTGGHRRCERIDEKMLIS
jgi:hypothetical protein